MTTTASVTPWLLKLSLISCLSHRATSRDRITPLLELSVRCAETATGTFANDDLKVKVT